MSSAILVTGGTGLIGGELILALLKQGHPVRAIVRASSDDVARQRLLARLEKSDSFDPELAGRLEAVAGDTARELFGVAPERLTNLRAVIHCAANTQFSERESENVWNTNVNGARHLVSLAKTVAPSARIVFISTASVTTAPEGACVGEDTPYGGHSNAYTLSKREAEGTVLRSGLDAVILRPSIVLSRGVRDRAMARSILWAVPIMGELGEVPIDPDARIDIVPVDHVAHCIAQVALQPTLRARVYHVSAGKGANSFAQLRQAVVEQHPEMRRIRPVGRHATLSSRLRTRLLRPLAPYLFFINAGICYANDTLVSEFGAEAVPPAAVLYVPDLVGEVTLDEALDEMYRP